jgi:hypothetical protein
VTDIGTLGGGCNSNMFDYDLYIYCEKKSEKMIRNFLTKYNADAGRLTVDEAHVFRSIEELFQDNLGEWVKITDTDSWIKFGLSEQSIAFSIYYSLPTPPIDGLIITFTIDGGIVLGISVELGDNKENFEYAKELLESFKEEYDAILTGLFVEEPPPFSKDLFIKVLKEQGVASM